MHCINSDEDTFKKQVVIGLLVDRVALQRQSDKLMDHFVRFVDKSLSSDHGRTH